MPPTMAQLSSQPWTALAAPGPPRFDLEPPPGGYLWWYIDGISDDGASAITLIAMIGSVFSPYYKASGRGRPLDHVALNVALYGPRARWCLTERGARDLAATPETLAIGPSRLAWAGDRLTVDIDEQACPLPFPVRGRVTAIPTAITDAAFAIDGAADLGAARHLWRPFAPSLRIEVELDPPGLSWTGVGYLDANTGSEPLEAGFRSWTWSRAHTGADTIVLYDAAPRRREPATGLALRFGADGRVEPITPPPRAPLSPGPLWRVGRSTRADGPVRVTHDLEDTPFYTRSRLATTIGALPVEAFHESLDLDRFAAPWVQRLLPFRMPRRAGRT